MSDTKAAALAALKDAVPDASADDYPTPGWWERPPWWRDEFDEFVPMARDVINTATQGRTQLYRHREPEAFAESKRASEEKRKTKQASAKVAHFTERVAYLEARIAELMNAVQKGCAFAKQANGEPYEHWGEVDADLVQARSQLGKAERAPRDWTALLPPSAPPKV